MLNVFTHPKVYGPNEVLYFFGGAYGNLEALVALKRNMQQLQVTEKHVFNTGDSVAYCANPLECLEIIQAWGINSIAGNVEQQLALGSDDCACNFVPGGRCAGFSKDWYPFVKERMTEENLNWMRTLPEILLFGFGSKRVAVLHGSHENASEYLFKSSSQKRKLEVLDALKVDGVVAGHCGLPFFDNLGEGKFWFNPGVIGMPANEGKRHTYFGSLRLGDAGIEPNFHRLNYDWQSCQAKILEHHLPLAYAKTLETGLWDNCEILPPEESNQQGAELQLLV